MAMHLNAKSIGRIHAEILGPVPIIRTVLFQFRIDSELSPSKDVYIPDSGSVKLLFPFADNVRVLPGDPARLKNAVQEVVREEAPVLICMVPPIGRFTQGPPYIHPAAVVGLEGVSIWDTLESLPGGASLLALLPASWLYTMAGTFLRSYISGHSLKWIVEFERAQVFPELHAASRFCSVVVEAGSSGNGPIRMLKAALVDDSTGDELLAEVRRLRQLQGGRTTHGYVLRKRLGGEGCWGVDANDPIWQERLGDVASLGGLVPLENIATIAVPPHQIREANRQSIQGARLITGRNIFPEGHLTLDTGEPWDRVREVLANHVALIPGDFVVRRIRSSEPLQQENLVVARVPEGASAPVYADHSVIVIRLGAVPLIWHEVLLDYLRSRRAADWLAAQKPGAELSVHLLGQLPVPMPDRDTLEAVSQCGVLAQQLAHWQEEITSARRQLLQLGTVKEGRDRLIEVTTTAEQRVQAAAATATFGWKIRNLYPLPLAYRWRELEGVEPGLNSYRRLLGTAEVLVEYLAILALVFAEQVCEGNLPGYIGTIAARLRRRPSSGMNFGDWISLLGEVAASKKPQALGPSTPLYEVSQVLTEDFKAAMTRLKLLRDDDSHDRGPKADWEAIPMLANMQLDLETMFTHASFATRYRLRHIIEAEYQVRRETTEYRFSELIGDHPIIPTQAASYQSEVALQQGAIYLSCPNGSMLLVSPWLVRLPCPLCHNLEVYAFDQLDRDTGKIVVKSLERGHPLEREDLRSDLSRCGLLP